MSDSNLKPGEPLPNWTSPVPGSVKIKSGWGKSRAYRNELGKPLALHKGVDIVARVGTLVQAIGDGKVVKVHYWNPGGGTPGDRAGNYVRIRHPNGLYSDYMHLSEISVRPGDKVTGGEQIGKSGNTGGNRGNKGKENATPMTPHLHFQILDKSLKPIPPLEYVKFTAEREVSSTNSASGNVNSEWFESQWLNGLIAEQEEHYEDDRFEDELDEIFSAEKSDETILGNDELSIESLIESVGLEELESNFENNPVKFDTESFEPGGWIDTDGDGTSDMWVTGVMGSLGFLDLNAVVDGRSNDDAEKDEQTGELDIDDLMLWDWSEQGGGVMSDSNIDDEDLSDDDLADLIGEYPADMLFDDGEDSVDD